MVQRTLVLTAENILAWKIAVVPYGSEGESPRNMQECPYFLERGMPSKLRHDLRYPSASLRRLAFLRGKNL